MVRISAFFVLYEVIPQKESVFFILTAGRQRTVCQQGTFYAPVEVFFAHIFVQVCSAHHFHGTGRQTAEDHVYAFHPQVSDEGAEGLGTGNVNVGYTTHGQEQCVAVADFCGDICHILCVGENHGAGDVSHHGVIVTIQQGGSVTRRRSMSTFS